MKGDPDNRIEIPLRMIDGNLEILLENELECEWISLKRDPLVANGVLLTVRMNEAQREKAKALGWKSTKISETGERQ